jgi:hypothetical protein
MKNIEIMDLLENDVKKCVSELEAVVGLFFGFQEMSRGFWENQGCMGLFF